MDKIKMIKGDAVKFVTSSELVKVLEADGWKREEEKRAEKPKTSKKKAK